MVSSPPSPEIADEGQPVVKRARTDRPILSSFYRPRPHRDTSDHSKVSASSTSPVLTSASTSTSETLVTPSSTSTASPASPPRPDPAKPGGPRVILTHKSAESRLPARPSFTSRSSSNKARPARPTKAPATVSPRPTSDSSATQAQKSETLSQEELNRRADETIARLTAQASVSHSTPRAAVHDPAAPDSQAQELSRRADEIIARLTGVTPAPEVEVNPEAKAISEKVDEVIARFEREAQAQAQVHVPQVPGPILLPKKAIRNLQLKPKPKPKLANQIYIGNLPLTTQLAGLRKAFESVSPILTIELRAPFAMIEFEQDGMAEKAVEEYDEGSFDGVEIRVERAPL